MSLSDNQTKPQTRMNLPFGQTTLAAAGAICLFASHAWLDSREDGHRLADDLRSAQLVETCADILRLDGVLTMSARMAAVTGDRIWVDRYDRHKVLLDKAVAEAEAIIPPEADIKAVALIEKANRHLIGMEAEAFRLMEAGRRDEAVKLLAGPLYERRKGEYTEGMKQLVRDLNAYLQSHHTREHVWLRVARYGQAGLALVLLVFWCLGLRRIFWAWRKREANYQETLESLRLSREHLAKSHDFVECTIHCISDIFYAFDTEGRFLRWNNALIEQTGYEEPELATMRMLDFYDSDDRAKVSEAIESMWREGDMKVKASLRRKDGTLAPYELTATVIRDRGGNAVGFAGTGRSLEDRRNMEAKLESLSRFPSENPFPVLRIGSDGRLLFANNAGKWLFDQWGIEVGQMVPLLWRKLVHEALGPDTVERMEIEHGQTVLSFLAVPVADAGYVNIYGEDITDRKRDERKNRKAREDAERASQERKAESARVSHEVRTFLTTILGFTEMLSNGQVDPEERDEYVAAIDRNCRELMATMLQQEAGQEQVEPSPPAPPDHRPEDELPSIAGRFLVADDGPDNRCLVSTILRKAGGQVDEAATGLEALDTALAAEQAGEPHDLIVMDMQMPEMDGLEATRRLRQAGYSGAILALTAWASVRDRQRCMDAGCDGYTVKPVERARLLDCVVTLLGRTPSTQKSLSQPQSSRGIGEPLRVPLRFLREEVEVRSILWNTMSLAQFKPLETD